MGYTFTMSNLFPPSFPSRRAGFTLVEMLVVVAIIALLASILVPATSTALSRGREVKCMSNMRQWGTAVSLHLQSSPNQVFPTEGSGSFGLPDLTEQTAWFNVLPPLVGEKPLLELLNQDGALPRPRDGSMWTCPAIPADAADSFPDNRAFFSFGYNLWIDHSVENPNQRTQDMRNAGLIPSNEKAPFPALLRAVNIAEPTRFCVFAEVADARYGTYNIAYVAYRHRRNQVIHMVFADGSARAYAEKDIGVSSGKHNNRGGIINCPGGREL